MTAFLMIFEPAVNLYQEFKVFRIYCFEQAGNEALFGCPIAL